MSGNKVTDWQLIGETPGKSWSVPSRKREDKHPIEPKLLFEMTVGTKP